MKKQQQQQQQQRVVSTWLLLINSGAQKPSTRVCRAVQQHDTPEAPTQATARKKGSAAWVAMLLGAASAA
jgi:hypothetical protein